MALPPERQALDDLLEKHGQVPMSDMERWHSIIIRVLAALIKEIDSRLPKR